MLRKRKNFGGNFLRKIVNFKKIVVFRVVSREELIIIFFFVCEIKVDQEEFFISILEMFFVLDFDVVYLMFFECDFKGEKSLV